MLGRLSGDEKECVREYLKSAMWVGSLLSVSAARYESLLDLDTPSSLATSALYHAYRMVLWEQIYFENNWSEKVPNAARKDYQIQTETICSATMFARFNHVAIRDDSEADYAEAAELRRGTDDLQVRATRERGSLGKKADFHGQEVLSLLPTAGERVGSASNLLREATESQSLTDTILLWRVVLEQEDFIVPDEIGGTRLFSVGLAAQIVDRKIRLVEGGLVLEEIDDSATVLARSVIMEEVIGTFLKAFEDLGAGRMTSLVNLVAPTLWRDFEDYYYKYRDLESREALVAAIMQDLVDVCSEPEEVQIVAELLFDEELEPDSEPRA